MVLLHNKSPMHYRMQVCTSLGQVPQAEWNALLIDTQASKASGESLLHPALQYTFLNILEQTQCVGPLTGWEPRHLLCFDEHNVLKAALPLYLKWHSYGEYVFDWAWAEAYQRHGMDYFPKLVSTLPFSPISAPKLIGIDPQARQALVRFLSEVLQTPALQRAHFGHEVSGCHILFTSPQCQMDFLQPTISTKISSNITWMKRSTVQFHWHNLHPSQQRPYSSFDDFLSALNAKKRKNIRAERRKALEYHSDVYIEQTLGDAIGEEDLNAFFQCYVNTYAKRRSTPYLNLDCFKALCTSMGQHMVFVLAKIKSTQAVVASAMMLKSAHTLYGRYWGSLLPTEHLHFELCYYQGLEYAIQHGMHTFEGGAQGEHKMARGFMPTLQESLHTIAHPGFAQAIGLYCQREQAQTQSYFEELQLHGAYGVRGG